MFLDHRLWYQEPTSLRLLSAAHAHVRAVGDEKASHVDVTLEGGVMESRPSALAEEVDVRAILEGGVDSLGVSFAGGPYLCVGGQADG